MEAIKILGWVLLILGVLDLIRILIGTVAFPVINWIVTVVLVVVGLIMLLKK